MISIWVYYAMLYMKVGEVRLAFAFVACFMCYEMPSESE